MTICHFAGLEKPWKYPRRSRYTKEWLNYFEAGVSENIQKEDMRVIGSRSGSINLSKLLIPLYERFLNFYEVTKKKIPVHFKEIIRRF